jgi:ribosome-associated protein
VTKQLTTLAKKKLVVAALEDIKAHDILAIDVRKITSMFDWIVVASADSARQTKALARHVRDKLKEAGSAIIGTEGEEGAEWVLVDSGDIVTHIMQPAVRMYYNLEELWGEGRFDRPANPTSPSGARLAHASDEEEEEHPSLPHGKPKPRAKTSPATRRKPGATGSTPGTRPRAKTRTKTRKSAATATGAAKPRRRKPAA